VVLDTLFALDLNVFIEVLEVSRYIVVSGERVAALRALGVPDEVGSGTPEAKDALSAVITHLGHGWKSFADEALQLLKDPALLEGLRHYVSGSGRDVLVSDETKRCSLDVLRALEAHDVAYIPLSVCIALSTLPLLEGKAELVSLPLGRLEESQ
jgi:hypothetical protein